MASATATAAVAVLPSVRLAYRAPALHVALETANAIIAGLVAFLMYGRFRERRRSQDLLIVLGLASGATANLALIAIPLAVTFGRETHVSPGAALAIRFLGTVLLATAALSPPKPVGRVLSAVFVTTATVAVLTLGLLGSLSAAGLPSPVTGPEQSGQEQLPVLVSQPVVLGVQVLGVLLYAMAAVAFTRQANRRGDELLRWIGAGCVLASAARIHYLLFPSLQPDFVYTGDVLRIGSYVFMLTGAAREIRSYWEVRARNAVLEDRRRVARELHDGLAQELAFIAAHSRRLSARPDDLEAAGRIGAAAGRAQAEARRAIGALSRPDDMPFTEMLQQSLDDLADRYDVKILTELDRRFVMSPAQGEALVRIVGEAVRNAVRHGHADRIEVQATAQPLRLAVSDNGSGFVLGKTGGRGGGFGLTSMRERARSLGARLAITSEPGTGTTVTVTWP